VGRYWKLWTRKDADRRLYRSKLGTYGNASHVAQYIQNILQYYAVFHVRQRDPVFILHLYTRSLSRSSSPRASDPALQSFAFRKKQTIFTGTLL
jgi:hypothetical protein